MFMAGRQRIVIAKPGLDGHDRGAKVVARALRDAGHEVIYTGLRRTPEQIIMTAMDEDASFLVCLLSGAHGHLFPKICKLLIEQGMGDVIVFAEELSQRTTEKHSEAGIRAIFGPGTSTEEILSFIDEAVQKPRVSVESGWKWQGCEGLNRRLLAKSLSEIENRQRTPKPTKVSSLRYWISGSWQILPH